MALGGAGGTADAVPAGAAAQQDDHVTGSGALPADIFRGGGGDHRAALQPLGDEALVIKLRHMAGGKTDLVAVGRIACGGGLTELPLGELAGQGVLQGSPGVARAGDTHGLVDIGPTGQRIPNAAADAGGGTAEGLDFRGMVVGLVLEHQQPVLIFAVYRGGNVDGAGVDFLALVQLRKLALFFQVFCADGGNVHEGLGPLGGFFLAVDCHPGGQVLLISRLHPGIVNGDAVQVGGEGGVTAVVGPVGVHHPNFGDGGIPMLGVPEVGLEEFQIVQIHGKPQLLQKRGQCALIHGGEALHGGNGFRSVVVNRQGFRHVQRSLPAFHGVDDVFLNGSQLFAGNISGEHIDLGGADDRPVALGNDLDALGSGVCPLVILTGQRLHGEDNLPLGSLEAHVIHLGLGEHGVHRVTEELLIDVFRIVPIQNPKRFQPLDLQKVPDLAKKTLSLLGLARLFLYINPIYHMVSSLIFRPAGLADRCRFCGRLPRISPHRTAGKLPGWLPPKNPPRRWCR